MQISDDMRAKYGVFKEAFGGDLEKFTSEGWHLIGMCTTKQRDCVSGQVNGNIANGQYLNAQVSMPADTYVTTYLLDRARTSWSKSINCSRLHW
jgi:hypothetical protein